MPALSGDEVESPADESGTAGEDPGGEVEDAGVGAEQDPGPS